MNIERHSEQIQDIIDGLYTLDEDVLAAVATIVHSANKKDIIIPEVEKDGSVIINDLPGDAILGYDTQGKALTVKQFLEVDAPKAEADIAAGNFITLEDWQKKTEAWLESIK